MNLLALSVAVVAFAAPVAAAQTTTTLRPVRDTTVYESPTGALANARGTALFAGRSSQSSNSIRRGLLAFDFSAIPAGSTILSVTLTLRNTAPNIDPSAVSLHRALASWGEGTSLAGGNQGGGGVAGAGDATWIHRALGGAAWTTPGGDFAAGASASIIVGGPGAYSWSSAALVADVQAMLDQPGLNQGWFLRGDESVAGSAKRFATREDPSATARPSLAVQWVVPAPGTAGVLALGAGMLIRRRRHAE